MDRLIVGVKIGTNLDRNYVALFSQLFTQPKRGVRKPLSVPKTGRARVPAPTEAYDMLGVVVYIERMLADKTAISCTLATGGFF